MNKIAPKWLKVLGWMVLMILTSLMSLEYALLIDDDPYPLGKRLRIESPFYYLDKGLDIKFTRTDNVYYSYATDFIPSCYENQYDSVSRERKESVDVVERYSKFLLVGSSDRLTGERHYYIVDKACDSPTVDWTDDLSMYIFSTDDSVRFIRRCEELGMTDSYWHKNGKSYGKE